MRVSRLLWIVVLFSARAAAQGCPAINFRNASQATLGGHTDSGMQRLSDGSFTLHTYSATGTIASVQQLSPTPQYQRTFFNCSSHTQQGIVPPANWTFLGDPLLGSVPRNPATGSLLGPGSAVGLCLRPCGINPNMLQMVVSSSTGNIVSSPSYSVTADAGNIITADLNHDGLQDVILPDSDTGSVFVYLMQANGTLGAPTTVAPGSGGYSVTAADFNGDGNIDLAVTGGPFTSNFGEPGVVTILLGKGDGTFLPPTTLTTGGQPESIIAADLNGDSRLDLVVVTAGGGLVIHFGNGNGTFGAAQTVSVPGGNLTSVAAADLNHDGKLDLVAVDAADGVVLVMLNAGNGTFPAVAGYAVGTFEDINQMFVMDFDWDGNLDIVFAAGHPDSLMPATFTNAVTVLFGNGDGTFSGIPAYATAGTVGSDLGGLAVADFNGDGKADAVAGSTSGISLLIGHGDGTFSPQALPFQQGSSSLAAGDFNHDGKMDFVATSNNGISVFLGGGNGTFQQSASIFTSSSGITGAAVGDFNGDSKLDFVVADSAGGTSASVLVYLGNGDGTFQNPLPFTAGSSPKVVQAVDVNGDGKLDLVVTNYGTFFSSSDPGSVAVLLGNGDGTFQNAVQYTAGTGPAFTLATDINGDGKPDLITSTELDTNNFVYGLIVRLNQGSGSFGSPQSVVSNYSPSELGAADFNGDGKVDLLVGHCCGDTPMGYMVGNGNGTFQPEAFFISGAGQVNVRVADLNGDGKPDALYTLFGPYTAALTNTGGSASAGGITIQTIPSGRQFTVDGGAPQTAPSLLNLSQGTHIIAVATPQAGSTGTQYVFSSWSDGGAASHTITVGSSAATYTATFQTQYLLTPSVVPPGAGTVTPSSPTYYPAGTVVSISASPAGGYFFTVWTGSVASMTSASTTVTMSGPQSVTANFSTSPTFTLSPTSINVLAAAGNGTVMVMTPNGSPPWTAVSNSSFLTITSGSSGAGNGTVAFSVAANTSGVARTGTLTIAGLTFTVNQSAVNTAGLGLFPVTPCRVADTRTGQGFTGQFGPPTIGAGQTRSFTIPASNCNIPVAAQAYSLNVTVVPRATLNYLTIWPAGQAQPFVSTLNSSNGAVIANAAIVPAGAGGAVSVFVTDATDLIIDINGYFAPPTTGALSFYPVTPCRVADTRSGTGQFGAPSLPAGGTRTFGAPASQCGIPNTAQAYSLNMTAVPPAPLDYLTTWPTGSPQPNVSTLNALQGQIAANAAIVPAGTNGAINVYVSDASNVVVDINGYFAPAGGAGALYFYPVTPCRVADTRNATGNLGGPSMGAGSTRTFPVPSSLCGLPSTAPAYSFNFTVVPSGPLLYLSTWPAGLPQPLVSTLNDEQAQVVANAAIVPSGAGGAISVFVSDAANVVIDVNGFFNQ